MHLKRALFFGFLLWVLVFTLISVLEALGVYQLDGVKFMTVVAYGLLSYHLTARIKPEKFLEALDCAAIWLAVNLGLDLLITQKLTAENFYSKTLWSCYLLLLLGPLLWGFEHRSLRQDHTSDQPSKTQETIDTWI